ncbi:MAG: flavoredoxin [Candidatus Goldiibacteriota bacterium HGW-Goldbacteria-1]|jgi:flavin reductase (DIM6/NTAB) family NADH-FMN oxidoreductase RutF|nr:MAG: flavoredoxin [Candidatus Goldiibacteriota bacterium HGW-Goldbacteria-1]
MKKFLAPQPILLPSPVLIIGTYGENDAPNIMNAAWGGIASSKPPCISISVQPVRLTHENIIRNKCFTINIPSEKFVKQADYAGLVSGREYNKFEEAKLTPEKSALVNAPYIKEFPYCLECKLVNTVNVGSHTMFIGEIVGIVADSNVLGKNSLPDIKKVKPIMFGSFGSRAYYGVGNKIGDAFAVGSKIKKTK